MQEIVLFCITLRIGVDELRKERRVICCCACKSGLIGVNVLDV